MAVRPILFTVLSINDKDWVTGALKCENRNEEIITQKDTYTAFMKTAQDAKKAYDGLFFADQRNGKKLEAMTRLATRLGAQLQTWLSYDPLFTVYTSHRALPLLTVYHNGTPPAAKIGF